MEWIVNEAVESLNIHWLKLVVSFEIDNIADSQFDMYMTAKSFMFRSFEVVMNAPPSDAKADKLLMEFYLKNAKPQYHGALKR